MKKTVAIQGVKGSFHEIAARQYFGEDNCSVVECETFPAFFKCMEAEQTDFGIMAIENSVVGTIQSNYGLLKDSGLFIVGEKHLRIEHHLLGLENQTINDINEVQSHRMALLQCDKIFKDYSFIRLKPANDTAAVAKEIAEKKIKGVAAIASRRAAEITGLSIIKENIENNSRNFTRFFVLSRNQKDVLKIEEGNKLSIRFHVTHRPGSLAQVLGTFSYYSLNLTKIQSMPVIGKEWEYYFHVDVEYNDAEVWKQCEAAIQPYITAFQIFGIYKREEK